MAHTPPRPPKTPPPVPPRRPGTGERISGQIRRFSSFGRAFSSGINRQEIEQLFERDAGRAFTVLSRSPGAEARGDDLEGFFDKLQAFFAGIALELSPGRRLLFAGALLCPFLGFLDMDMNLGPYRLYIDSSPLWFLASISALTLLVALELVDQMRVRDEVELARQLQRDLLPQASPNLPGYRVAHSYCTANDIGGDYYEFLPLEDGRWAIAVGDASGHGIGAGLLMAIANATLKTALDLDPSPSAVMHLLNRALLRTGSRRAFMTLFYGVLDPRTGELEFAGSGHPFPRLRKAGGEILELGQGALPLGMREIDSFATGTARIDVGDTLVLYSDGLPEAANAPEEEAFGFERMDRLIKAQGEATTLHGQIVAAVDRHRGEAPLRDDMTVVVMHRAAPPPPAPLPPTEHLQ